MHLSEHSKFNPIEVRGNWKDPTKLGGFCEFLQRVFKESLDTGSRLPK